MVIKPFIPGHGDDSLEDYIPDQEVNTSKDHSLESFYATPLYTPVRNLLDNPYMIHRLMVTYPIIIPKIIQAYQKDKTINTSILFKDLPNNQDIASESKINQAKEELLEYAELIHNISKTPLVGLLDDPCITNKYVSEGVFRKIFGSKYKKFVMTASIDYNSPPKDQPFEIMLEKMKNMILFIPGSQSNTYDMDLGHFSSKLAQFIKDTGSDYSEKKLNNRILGVCFGHQYVCKLLSEQNRESGTIGVTNRHIWHCGLSSIEIALDQYAPEIYKNALSGLTDGKSKAKVTAVFTRGSAFHDDLLSSGEKGSLIPLAFEPFTGLNVIHGVKNGRILTVQPHFEIPMTQKAEDVLEWVNDASKSISKNMRVKIDPDKVIENFGYSDLGNKYVSKDLDEAFYVFALLAFAKDIYTELIKTQSSPIETEEYVSSIAALRGFTRWRVNGLLPGNEKFDSRKSITSFIEQVDKTRRLRVNTSFDWKVDRGIGEGSKILGLKNLAEFIKYIKYFHNNNRSKKTFLVLDIGAGDGTMISELYRELSGYDIIEYGVGDFLYLDLYHIFKNSYELIHIPNKLKIIFVNKVLQNIKDNSLTTLSVQDQLKIATKNLEFISSDKVSHGSMFSEETNMFPGEELESLGQEGLKYIEDNIEYINQLIESCNNFYSHCNRFSDRIYISSFSDLRTMPNNMFRYPDFQYSIRSTSHIDGLEYTNFIYETIHERMKNGGILLDNGVHRSYTSIPRIPELHKVFKDSKVPIRMRLIFDTNTNYFTAVLVERFPFIEDDTILDKNLAENTILIDIEEAYKSTFFRIEHFLRNMIIANFQLKDVFWDYNRDIVKCVQDIINILGNGESETQNIINIIVKLLSKISLQKQAENENLYGVSAHTVTTYELNGIYIKDILQDFYHPDWINPNGKRYY